jgi:hypothetical protein
MGPLIPNVESAYFLRAFVVLPSFAGFVSFLAGRVGPHTRLPLMVWQ